MIVSSLCAANYFSRFCGACRFLNKARWNGLFGLAGVNVARIRYQALILSGALMGIDLVDHIILGDVRYCSLKEMGAL